MPQLIISKQTKRQQSTITNHMKAKSKILLISKTKLFKKKKMISYSTVLILLI